MKDPVLRGAVCTLLLGCSLPGEGAATDTDEGSETEQDASATNPNPSDPTVPATSASTTTTTTDDGTGQGPDSGPDSDGDATEDDTGEPTGETNGPDPSSGCPDELPAGWILCEDFEGIENPSTYFNAWGQQTGADDIPTFRVSDVESLSPSNALEVRHNQTLTWAGQARIGFGRGPIETVHAPDSDFDEVWVRLHVMLDAEWNTGGFGDLIEVNGLTLDSRHTMSASLDGLPGTTTLRSRSRTCVNAGGVFCPGNMDYNVLQQVAVGDGSTDFFSTDYAGDFHCVVLHVRLNDPGQSNGVQRAYLDDNLEVELTDIDFRGGYEATGINALLLSAFWGGGTPSDRQRFIDDIVVAETELGCSS